MSIDELIDAIDKQTRHDSLKLDEQPYSGWPEGERIKWCVGYVAGQQHLANEVRKILKKFIEEQR